MLAIPTHIIKRQVPGALSSLCALALLVCAAPLVRGADVRFDHISADRKQEDIGPVKALAQDRMGFIWIGAEYGLARYDGNRMVRYPFDEHNPHALSNNYINDLLVDREGELWIATEYGLNWYRSQSDDFQNFFPDKKAGSNRVAALAVDQKNTLIMAHDRGVTLFDSKRESFRKFPVPESELLYHVSFQEAYVDRDNTIWLGSRGGGAATLDPRTGQFQFFRHDTEDPSSINGNDIVSITQDPAGKIWFGTASKGISRYDPQRDKFDHFTHDPQDPKSIGSNTIWDIYTDSHGQIWVATDPGGLARFDAQTQSFSHYRHKPYDIHSISSDKTRTVFEDRAGDLWIGVFPSGVDYINRSAAQFTNYTHKPDDAHSISNSSILTFFQDMSGEIWVGTEDGLNTFQPDAGRFERFQGSRNSEYSLRSKSILSIAQTRPNEIWVGTWSGGLHRLEKENWRFHHYATDETDATSLNNAFVWSMVTDSRNRLWLGTEGGGLNLYQPETDDFRHFKHNANDPSTINSNFIWTMLVDKDGKIWVGTTAGLNLFDPESETFKRFERRENDPTTIQSDRVRSLFQDSRGQVWIGTQDDGFYIYNPKTERFRHFSAGLRLPSRYITGFIEDRKGYIWATTTNGVMKISPNDMQMELFTRNDGLVGNNFNREANFIDEDGRIFLGASEGISTFYPDNVNQNTHSYPVLLTDFKVLNKSVGIGDDSPLEKAIWQTRNLVLDHRHPMFSFEFSALNYRDSDNLQYAYKLEGFGDHWINTAHNNQATFTNLSPGKYRFKVKGGNGDQWSERISEINVIVLPPPWRTWWAYALYVATLVGFIYLLANSKIQKIALSSERALNLELKKLNDIKDAFLANTSHELRTPLNGIIGIADSLNEQFKGRDANAAHRLQLISSSGRRLANLINDILDYSKLAKGNLELHRQAVDLKSVTDMVFALLAPLTANKDLTLQNELEGQGPKVYADENRLQQILINLIGNGIKYTESGEVTVSVRQTQDHAQISVQDSGIGISSEHFQRIFEAFNQIQNHNKREHGGSGLGLAITRQLVELHGGEIWAEEAEHGGARFVFTLPLWHSALQGASEPVNQDVQKVKPSTKPLTIGRVKKDESMEFAPSSQSHQSKPRNAKDQTILIVDDDSVNRLVLNGILALHHYKVLEANNGEQAINMVKSHPEIDLVILDVMMPHMNGFETCRIIRETHPLHTLPILFLTAQKNVDEDIAECFSVGANDYLCKPVSKIDLLPRVANHLRIYGVIRNLQMDLHSCRQPDNLVAWPKAQKP